MTEDRIEDLKCKAIIFYIGLVAIVLAVWWCFK